MSPRVVRTRRIRLCSTSRARISVFSNDPERACGPAALAHDRPRAQRVDHAGRGRVEAADDHRLVDVGDELLHLCRCHERRRLDSPRDRRGEPAPELLEALLAPCNLDAAACGEHAELLVLADALERQLRHLARVVDREDEVGGMAGRAARVGKRALVEEHHAVPAEPGQVVGDAATDDPRPDHDRPRSRRQRCRGYGMVGHAPILSLGDACSYITSVAGPGPERRGCGGPAVSRDRRAPAASGPRSAPRPSS